MTFDLAKAIKDAKKQAWERGEVVRDYITCACGHRHVYEGRKGEEPVLIVVLDASGFPINHT